MAITTPILGNASVRIGLTSALTNDTPNGVWSSSDSTVASVDAGTGAVTGVGIGSAFIIYTVGADSISESFTVYQSTITNGFDISRLYPAFQGRLGWHQPTISGMPVLSTANKTATSGKYYDRGYHKAVSIQNDYQTQEDPKISDDQYNQLLQDEDQAVLMRCLNAVFNRSQLIEHVANYIRVANRQTIIIENNDLFMGQRITVSPGNYAVNIDSIGLLFDGVTTFNMYLFNDLVLPPVYTKSVTTEAFNQVRVQMDWVMNYINSSNSGNLGGIWYMGYFQRDLNGVHAIDEQLNMYADTKVFGTVPFQTARVGELDFNRVYVSANFRTYGFNMEVSSYRDYTQMLIQNKSLFDEARGLTMAIEKLEQILFSSRTNGNQRIMQELTMLLAKDLNMSVDIDPKPYVSALQRQLEREMVRICNNFTPREIATSVNISGDANNGIEWQYEGFDIRSMPSRQLPAGILN